MAIIYYPNRIPRPFVSSVEKTANGNRKIVESGSANVASSALDVVISAKTPSWKINSISLNFSSSSPKNYSWSIINGRKIIKDLNDYLWIQSQNPSSLWKKITLDEGFYSGDELAAHLESKLDTEFDDIGITFTVAYNNLTGVFTVTPSSGTIKYIDKNNSQPLPFTQSIAGHLFGFTATNSFSSTLTSDTSVPGLNNEAILVSESSSAATYHYNDDAKNLHVDQALHISSNTASMTISYEVFYEELI